MILYIVSHKWKSQSYRHTPGDNKDVAVIRECEKQNIDYFILHTGQHYPYNLDKIFFEELELPAAKYYLDVGSGTHAEETGKMLMSIEKVLKEEKPDVVLVEGDTNIVLAGALAASKLHVGLDRPYFWLFIRTNSESEREFVKRRHRRR